MEKETINQAVRHMLQVVVRAYLAGEIGVEGAMVRFGQIDEWERERLWACAEAPNAHP